MSAGTELKTAAVMLGDGRLSFGDARQRGLHVLWTDPRGVTHECSGNMVHPGIVLFWTLCERDVPADASHVAREGGDCPACIEADES